ncbi:MAG: hypothetical protein WBQ60_00785 [Asticcacaulis sp.]
MLSWIAGLMLSTTAAQTPPPKPDAAPFAAFNLSDCGPIADSSPPYDMPREVMLKALLDQHPLRVDISAFSGNQMPLSERIAGACDDAPCVAGHSETGDLNLAVSAMLDARQDDHFHLIWQGASPEPATRKAQIAAFFDMSQPGYGVQCLMEAPPPSPPPAQIAEAPEPDSGGLLSRLRIASTVNETEKADYKSRDPARFSYVDNASDSSPVASVKLAVVAPPVLAWGHTDDPTRSFGDIRPFVTYERTSQADKYNEINNVDLGVRSHFLFARDDGAEAYVGGLTAAYETDDSLKSSLLRFEASVRPPLKAWMRRMTGHDPSEACRWCQTSDLAFVADYVNVSDPGFKQALYDLPQYGRVGFDANWALRLNRGEDKSSFGVNFNYSLRQDLQGSDASARRFTTRAAYYPTPQSHYVFGLEYDQGRDLTSLVDIDRWMVTWGYRQ